MEPLWPYATPGIPDRFFEQLPGIPMSQREVRLAILSALRLGPKAVLWDIGAGTGTITVEAALLCPQGSIVAVERDEDVATLIKNNCQRFEISNVDVVVGNAPDCFDSLPHTPDSILVEGGRDLKPLLTDAWHKLASHGRLVVTAGNFQSLYAISESFADLQVRNIEVVQTGGSRLETRGSNQVLKPIVPIFILSGEKF
ncbi:precorrin-6Y C5,15-methyltransferase subunit CbiT [Leptolyngbyaceae cyanobacterium CCMR0082]|uniref:Precorrin-6Y C5,15-methyltransferase subunit CbiT n=2 Tax=Adonisia turfae TaxID=2950184 RepID=A0A6M0S0E3_9CYAN|nr:precorrin-6Y C5,15-methyltransferase subunit CbiT [Adonisia turfae]EKV02610.1 precorrin-6Y C5,15-methyltransferase (decarboxylating), CbiT subunit [Leptolyngbya sp. PCC 7375]MDV3350933.1 precorrin-6Y C5,15-methyltransferase subunit CbiT [Leptothoe sp. LEGE 181152]NEZ55188.1 precorrin-6Y C5,15-methyltransferase subunit CbiT [Adonisia turfae CCMR0081]NEZ61949.1 precorrin-6Y C5,15-methyltransferase subunit CbiT [Adonisia turfae CCMR0082]